MDTVPRSTLSGRHATGRETVGGAPGGEAEVEHHREGNDESHARILDVRTRADDGTDEAREGNYTDMYNSFASGAQIISTDYYRADPRAGTTGWTDYRVRFPNGELARIDSVSAADKLNLGNIKE